MDAVMDYWLPILFNKTGIILSGPLVPDGFLTLIPIRWSRAAAVALRHQPQLRRRI